jgi:capsular exopolysaccharide synthesis family protein
MSRIQDILSKAERDGTVRRTRSLTDEVRAPHAFTPTPPLAPLPDDRGGAPAHGRGRPELPEPGGGVPGPWTAGATAPVLDGDDPVQRVVRLDHRLVAALSPTSLAAEQYRSLRTRIKRAEGNRSMRAIAITSPEKGDGKSLTAANLALTMGQEFQHKVLLLDGDLRRPAVHRLFGIGEGPGLSDVLMGGAELDQVLVSLSEYHITILPAGTPPSHPAEILGSAAMRRVLDTLRSRFDRVLLDMPPVAPLADLHIVAPMVDGLLMIVRAGITPKPAIERALAGLEMSKVLGLVLNESGGERSSKKKEYEGYGYIAG